MKRVILRKINKLKLFAMILKQKGLIKAIESHIEETDSSVIFNVFYPVYGIENVHYVQIYVMLLNKGNRAYVTESEGARLGEYQDFDLDSILKLFVKNSSTVKFVEAR